MTEWEKQIFAINLIVGDLERSKAFYREVFGLAPLNELEDLALFRLKDTYVALRHDPAHQNAPAGEVLGLAQKGVGQFAIVVEDVDAVRTELEEHGVTVRRIVTGACARSPSPIRAATPGGSRKTCPSASGSS
jgi:catechol 2,3-dioxygenase-like lactoylglutathione lyase family enzyme